MYELHDRYEAKGGARSTFDGGNYEFTQPRRISWSLARYFKIFAIGTGLYLAYAAANGVMGPDWPMDLLVELGNRYSEVAFPSQSASSFAEVVASAPKGATIVLTGDASRHAVVTLTKGEDDRLQLFVPRGGQLAVPIERGRYDVKIDMGPRWYGQSGKFSKEGTTIYVDEPLRLGRGTTMWLNLGGSVSDAIIAVTRTPGGSTGPVTRTATLLRTHTANQADLAIGISDMVSRNVAQREWIATSEQRSGEGSSN